MICIMIYINILHKRNGNIFGCQWTPYNLITFFNLCSVRHIRIDDICWAESFCKSSHIVQFNFNNFDAYQSTQIRKLSHSVIIFLESKCGKHCARSPQN